MLPLQGTLVSNPIKLTSPETETRVPALDLLPLTILCAALKISDQFYSANIRQDELCSDRYILVILKWTKIWYPLMQCLVVKKYSYAAVPTYGSLQHPEMLRKLRNQTANRPTRLLT